MLFNAVPLLALAALYLGVGLALVPSLWRDRRRLTAIDVGLGALFPCIAVPAAVFGFLVLHQSEPLGGELWSAFVATLVACSGVIARALLKLLGSGENDGFPVVATVPWSGIVH